MCEKFKLIGLLMLLTVFLLPVKAYVCFADEAKTIEEAFKNGKIKGTIGSYFEYTDKEVADSDYGWATGYLTLKYETQKWNRLSMGARFFAHGQLYSHHDNGTSDPFQSDIETKCTLPELYLNYGFAENSGVTVGRWNHKKVSHIDDAQSEGAYVFLKEIPNLEFIAGVMTRFAEIDYDDGEDFGRTNDHQDLNSEDTFGSDSKPYLFFIESKYKPLDMLTFNPYVMYQDGYAGVYGLDADIKYKPEHSGVTYGGRLDYYHVSADIAGKSDSDDFAVSPYIIKGPLTVTGGFAQFDDGNSLNKPEWLRDYLVGELDQDKSYGRSGCEVYFGKVKYKIGKFWAHFAYGDYNYNYTSSKGDRSQECELQFGYKFTKNLDVNLRLFDIQYDNVDNQDYKKVESRMRYKF